MVAPKGHAPYPGCETGGRPKKYTKEFIEKEAIALDEWRLRKNANEFNVFLEDFCLERGYSDQRISEWAKENEKFSEAYDRFKMRQRSAMYKGGLLKKFQYNMCALVLSHGHGIVAKTEQKISGDSSSPLQFLLEKADGQSKDLIVNE